MKKIHLLLLIALVGLSLQGCRGWRTEKTSIHLNPNMDYQSKYKAQYYTGAIPKGTVAWGQGDSVQGAERSKYNPRNTALNEGVNKQGHWLTKPPLQVTKSLLERGQARYNIYCAVCHDQTGSGKGLVIKRGYVPPPAFWNARVLNYSDGELFDIISNGIRTMPGYKKQIPVEDRWAIVTHIKVLQAMNTGSRSDVPSTQRNKIK